MKVAIVVPFYNGHQWLNKLIESFGQSVAGYDCTLYVIDNSPIYQKFEVNNQINLSVKNSLRRNQVLVMERKAYNRGYKLSKERGYDFMMSSPIRTVMCPKNFMIRNS